MTEQWRVEAENNARDLAEILYEQITDEADDLCVDRKWYFEKVVQYMRAESEDKNDSQKRKNNRGNHQKTKKR